MPLSNVEVEGLLKKFVIYRKNSLFYKIIKGALVGDGFMSVIQTAVDAKVNVLDYLIHLVKNEKNVKKQPEQWLPWNYLQRLNELNPAQV